jgi:hypothetical protein
MVGRLRRDTCPLFLFNTLPAIKVNLMAFSFAGTLLAISSGNNGA